MGPRARVPVGQVDVRGGCRGGAPRGPPVGPRARVPVGRVHMLDRCPGRPSRDPPLGAGERVPVPVGPVGQEQGHELSIIMISFQ